MPIIRKATINGVPCDAAHTRIASVTGGKYGGWFANLDTYYNTDAAYSGAAPICGSDIVQAAYVEGEHPYVTIYRKVQETIYAEKI